jgi:glycosyltransferase involved in cell wall biosynthesis
MISTVRPEKAHDVALAAIDLLATRFPRLRLLVVGTGPELARTKALAEPLGERVVFAGYQPDVLGVLAAVDLVLHPSRHEAFPTALLEAMAAGVPVIATSVGGIPEIVSDGEDGILVPSPPEPEGVAAALAALLEDDARRRQMGECGRERFAREFSGEAWARRLRAFYEDVLAA